jgi:uncharacterized membrane protein (UPF0136 family)
MNKTSTSLLVLLYGLLLIGLGLVGFLKAGSKISLAIGCGFGTVTVISAYLLSAKKATGLYLSTAISALLTIMFAIRYFNTHKPLTGIMAVLSGILLIYLLVQLTEKKKK